MDKLRHLQDAFFDFRYENGALKDSGELTYLHEILGDAPNAPRSRAIFNHIQYLPEEERYRLAQERIDQIENGEVPARKLEKVEGEICLLLGAKNDPVHEKVMAPRDWHPQAALDLSRDR